MVQLLALTALFTVAVALRFLQKNNLLLTLKTNLPWVKKAKRNELLARMDGNLALYEQINAAQARGEDGPPPGRI